MSMFEKVAAKNNELVTRDRRCSRFCNSQILMREARVCFPFNKRLRYPTTQVRIH